MANYIRSETYGWTYNLDGGYRDYFHETEQWGREDTEEDHSELFKYASDPQYEGSTTTELLQWMKDHVLQDRIIREDPYGIG